jgi:hypothetical protein
LPGRRRERPDRRLGTAVGLPRLMLTARRRQGHLPPDGGPRRLSNRLAGSI